MKIIIIIIMSKLILSLLLKVNLFPYFIFKDDFIFSREWKKSYIIYFLFQSRLHFLLISAFLFSIKFFFLNFKLFLVRDFVLFLIV
jgi:hypothetical protein